MDMRRDRIVVIGAGMGGLSAAIRLAAAGRDVTVLDAHPWPGGKMRVMGSDAGPVDAGPTVLTLVDVLDDLFAAAGRARPDHLALRPLTELARHFWSDGTRLDLTGHLDTDRAAIAGVFGSRAGADFLRFHAETAALYEAFDAPIMRAARPSVRGAARAAIGAPATWGWLAPGRSLQGVLKARFREPRLRQLFGRYATYVGGNPLRAPAVLGLIWQAEARGVWAVQGGMARLARALADLFTDLGGTLQLATAVARILTDGSGVTGVRLNNGAILPADAVVFNGDPLALPLLLGQAPAPVRPKARSLSARVWTFAARVTPDSPLGADAPGYHSVFFADDAGAEFGPLARGATPASPTVYVCAQDRLAGPTGGLERFQMILNAPATGKDVFEKDPSCQIHPCRRLAEFGLHLTPTPEAGCMTAPQDFARLFPASQGALYGMTPDHPLATFRRPLARGPVPGLVLAGGGAHPGAGVPMAILSGRHAAEALMAAPTSASMSRRTAMPGGMSTGSATTEIAPFRS